MSACCRRAAAATQMVQLARATVLAVTTARQASWESLVALLAFGYGLVVFHGQHK